MNDQVACVSVVAGFHCNCPLPGELERILDQVDEHLLEAPDVPDEFWNYWRLLVTMTR